MSILLKLFQKTEKDIILSNSFDKASVTLIPEPNKETRRKLEANIPKEYQYKNSQKKNKLNSKAY